MRDERTNEQTLKIELLSQWMLEAEFRKLNNGTEVALMLVGKVGKVMMVGKDTVGKRRGRRMMP